MRVEILTVGTEILLGEIEDTNSSYIARELVLNGIDCFFRSSVGDNVERIVGAIRNSLSKADAVIITGGLGPTQDDITREAIATVMNVSLEVDARALELTREFFKSRSREMPESNLKQAYVPSGGKIIEQRRGTAPGLICEVGNKVIYAMPGVPTEMYEMLQRAVVPDILNRFPTGKKIYLRDLVSWGIPESQLADILKDHLLDLDQSLANSLGSDGIVTVAFQANIRRGIRLRLGVKAENETVAKSLLDNEEAFLISKLGSAVFSSDGEEMEEVVARLLVEKELSVSIAESLTGGIVSDRLVNVRGASKWFKGSIVSYQDDIKHELLSVKSEDVVTVEAAKEMAIGAMTLFKSDIALSTTGIAGPDRVNDKEIGTVFIAIALRDRVIANLKGNSGNNASKNVASRNVASRNVADSLKDGSSPGSLLSIKSSSQADSFEIEPNTNAYVKTVKLQLFGGRRQIREIASMSTLDFLRRILLENSW